MPFFNELTRNIPVHSALVDLSRHQASFGFDMPSPLWLFVDTASVLVNRYGNKAFFLLSSFKCDTISFLVAYNTPVIQETFL